MNRREFFKVLLLTVSGALNIVKLPKPLLVDGGWNENDLSRWPTLSFAVKHLGDWYPDEWWELWDDGPIGTYRQPKKFEGLDRLINTGHIDTVKSQCCPPIDSII